MFNEVEVPNRGAINRDVGGMNLDELQGHGTDLVVAWDALERSRTDVLKDLARVVVGIRSQFADGNGNPDWAGRSWDYRSFISEMYSSAGVPPDSQGRVQSALRYHVGVLLRETLNSSELSAAGLLPAASSKRPRLVSFEAEMDRLERVISDLDRDEAVKLVEIAIARLGSIRIELSNDVKPLDDEPFDDQAPSTDQPALPAGPISNRWRSRSLT